MSVGNSRLISSIALMVAIIVLPRDARAYVDPNSAGLIYQIFFPLLVAVALAWRWIKDSAARLWNRIRRSTD
jgi:hypothetical protein